jgi:hypothetical protein
MRQGLRWMALGMAALAMAACGKDGGELRDATRERAERQQAEMDSLRRDSAAAAQRAGMDTANALPVFVGPPVDSASAAAGAPAPAPAAESPSETGDVGQDTGHAAPATSPPAPPAGAPGDWAMAVRDARRPGVAGTVTAMRAARNEGFDRVTLQFDGPRVPTYRVEYAKQGVQQCGSGERVAMDGRAALLIHVSSRAHDDAGHVTVAARDQKPGLPVIRQVSMVCDFEGVVEVAVGLAAPNKYRVVELGNPARLVVDVQQ